MRESKSEWVVRFEAGNKKVRMGILNTARDNPHAIPDFVVRQLIEADTKDGLAGNYAGWFQRVLEERRTGNYPRSSSLAIQAA